MLSCKGGACLGVWGPNLGPKPATKRLHWVVEEMPLACKGASEGVEHSQAPGTSKRVSYIKPLSPCHVFCRHVQAVNSYTLDPLSPPLSAEAAWQGIVESWLRTKRPVVHSPKKRVSFLSLGSQKGVPTDVKGRSYPEHLGSFKALKPMRSNAQFAALYPNQPKTRRTSIHGCTSGLATAPAT